MDLIVKGATACVTFFVGGVVTFIWLTLDILFKAIRLIRYGFLKAMIHIANQININTNAMKSCNKILCLITEQDIKDAAKTKELRL